METVRGGGLITKSDRQRGWGGLLERVLNIY